MKCILCGQRKGKRRCPAKNSLICARCCGEKRMVEVDCPPDCNYLESGHIHQAHRKFIHLLSHEQSPARAQRYLDTARNFGEVLARLEQAILRYAAGLTSIRDQDVLEAVELLKKNYQTEDKGVIFEHRSPNPLAGPLTKELRTVVEDLREGSEGLPPLRLSEALDCLENQIQDILYHIQESGQPLSYLQFITRTYPEIRNETRGSRLILP
ncbi:MAG: hypothetical protein V3T83_22195 [Acidobacteriota bacterium]